MPRHPKTRRLAAWMNGKHVGNWTIDAQGQHEFRYVQAWIEADETRPLSLSMPSQPPDAAGKNQLAPQEAKLAMAVRGKNRHYKWAEINARQWMSTAKEIGLEATAEEDILHMAESAAGVAETVSAMLPGDFPGEVSGPILDGLLRSAGKLAVGEYT